MDESGRLYYPATNGVTTSTAVIYTGSTANWNATPDLVTKSGSIYVYNDYATVDGTKVPAIKIGDGTSYLIDMPFVYSPSAVEGGGDESGGSKVVSKTTNEWNQDTGFVGVAGEIYVYTDAIDDEENKLPAIKIGDGNSYLIDTPFVFSPTRDVDDSRFASIEDALEDQRRQIASYKDAMDEMRQTVASNVEEVESIRQTVSSHINDMSFHVSPEDRERWNDQIEFVIDQDTVILRRKQ